MTYAIVDAREVVNDAINNPSSSLHALLDAASLEVGMPSMEGERHEVLARLRKALHVTGCFDGGRIVGIAMINVRRSLYYCPRKRHVVDNGTVYELGGAFLLPEYRGAGIYRKLFNHRLLTLRAARFTAGRKVIVEVRAKFVNGLPEHYHTNKVCWLDGVPQPHNPDALVLPLLEDRLSLCPSAAAAFGIATMEGFTPVGIDPYDNGAHLQLTL